MNDEYLEENRCVDFGFVKASQLCLSSSQPTNSGGEQQQPGRGGCQRSHEEEEAVVVTPPQNNGRAEGRRKRIHMDVHDCFEFVRTRAGSAALVNPFGVSRNISRYLHPRPRRGLGRSARGPRSYRDPTAGAGRQGSIAGYFRLATVGKEEPGPRSGAAGLSAKFGEIRTSCSSDCGDEEGIVTGDETTRAVNEKVTWKNKKRRRRRRMSRRSSSSSSSRDGWGMSDTGVIATPAKIESDASSDDMKLRSSSLSKNLYGLLGEDFCDESIDYFPSLPLEIKEIIFCQLPIQDLCLHCTRVCTEWNSIISSSKFMHWKKFYYKVRNNVAESRRELIDFMRENGMGNESTSLSSLLRYMKHFKQVWSTVLQENLQNHPKYQWAVVLLGESLCKEKNPGHIKKEESNPWCVMAALVILSDSLADTRAILANLLYMSSPCNIVEVLECLYCVATLLLGMKLNCLMQSWTGMHYRLYYALYLYESTLTVTARSLRGTLSRHEGRQTLMKYSFLDTNLCLTHEQMRIINHEVKYGEVIKIVAFAGTGKTLTLIHYTQMRPDKKFLLVVYNKSVCDYARKKFPPNVSCKTGHSLAFQKSGRLYAEKNKLMGNLKVYDVARALPLVKEENLYIRAKFVVDTLLAFMSSSDSSITMEHVDSAVRKRRVTVLQSMLEAPENPSEKSKKRYCKDAELIWKKMVCFTDHSIPMTHDGYLKLYQLSSPKLYGYDCILVDEAQDMTPALSSILLSQKQTKILVGDPFQQIYSFRGAVNAMDQIQPTFTFYLTQSFRFGPDIAFVANCVLGNLMKENRKILVGGTQPSKITGEQVGQLAIISRCNFTLFAEAVRKCCFNDEYTKVAFVGGTDAFGFPLIMDIYTLFAAGLNEVNKVDRPIKNKFVRMFKNVAELEKYATCTGDNELLGKLKIVKVYNHNLPVFLNRIMQCNTNDVTQADIVFTTAHKAKGLEFSTVRIMDDFNILPAGQTQRVILHYPENGDESNLLYVALTRAKCSLQMSSTLFAQLKLCGEKYQYPVLSSMLQKQGVIFKCLIHDGMFEPSLFTIRQVMLTLADDNVIAAGVICLHCINKNMAALFGVKNSKKEVLGPALI